MKEKMTENEAILYIKKWYQPTTEPKEREKCVEALLVILKCTEEIQQYRAIGTVEEIKDLLATISEAAEDVDESGISVGFVKDLIQLKKYREIGTVEECREAVEKQKAKKTDINGGISICRECGHHLKRCYDYCPECGQAIMWDKNLEGI